MKKKVFTRPVSVVLSIEMFQQVSGITERREISSSDFIREAIQEKLSKEITAGGIDHEN
jgi:metal-responsive CopG/Arc/MetJ family transcriptional regulator